MTQATDIAVFRAAGGQKAQDEIQERVGDIVAALLSGHSGDTGAAYAEAGMLQHFPTAAVVKLHNGASFLEMLTPVAAGPASDSATGTKGQFWLHSGGIDICVATDTWLRFAGAAFASAGV